VAVADAFSAMIQIRPYAEAKEPLLAARELADARNRFDSSFSGKLLAALASSSFGQIK
jgi:HD-GYP domain-containing protein (c-di-GMP phosphodiesterase class II)